MTDPVSNKDTIIALERKVWDALVTGDCDADNALLASDFKRVLHDVDHTMFVTSIWQQCKTGRENIFSQDTVV